MQAHSPPCYRGIGLVQNADIHRHTCQPFFWSTSIITPNPTPSSGEQLNIYKPVRFDFISSVRQLHYVYYKSEYVLL